MSTLLRIKQILEESGITPTNLEKKIGASKGVISRAINKDTDIQSKWISKIVENYPQYNAYWILTGKGSVKSNEETSTEKKFKDEVSEPLISYGTLIPKGAVPYFDLPVSAGRSIFEMEGAMKPDGYLKDIPGIGLTEAFLPVHGYSMYPEVKEGAMIGLRKAERWDHLNTQHKYLIITRDDRMVKYIQHDFDDNSILWCKSPNYDRFSILKSDIVEVHRVTFVMNPE